MDAQVSRTRPRAPPGGWFQALLFALAWLAAGVALAQSPPPSAAVPRSAQAAAVKAAYLLRFVGYVEWPAPLERAGPLLIGVVGADDVAAALAELLPQRTAGGRTIELRRLAPADDWSAVSMLFIDGEHLPRLRARLPALQARAVLVVSAADGGLDHGAAINLVTVDDRVRFEVAPEAAARAGLQLSSRLLAVARQVRRNAP